MTICEEWENDYLAFKEWALTHGYEDHLTIDRIDNDKGYSPENCRWVDEKAQANNRRNNRIVEFEGNQYTLSQLADKVGLTQATVKQRYENGWSIEDIVRTPHRSRKKWSEMQCS